MDTEDFFKEFSHIENHLFGLAGDFDRQQGFLNLLEYLQSKNLLPKDTLKDIDLVRQTINKIISSPSGDYKISDRVFNALTRLKKKLNL